MTLALLLVVLGVLSRLIDRPVNFVAMGAVALYAGARLPRRWAFAVPLAAMVLSDLYIDWGGTRGIFDPVRLSVYGAFALIVAIGRLPRRDAGPAVRLSMSLAGSILFFLITNLAVWLTWYPRDFEGLGECFAGAVPFFRNTLMADLIGTTLLFGTDWLVGVAYARRPAPAAVDVREG